MNFTDERYVRLYTRDTLTWKKLEWKARALLMFLLRKVNRAGVLELENCDPTADDGSRMEDLAVMLDLQGTDVVAVGLPQLVARGVVVACPVGYVMPRFLEAQEAIQSNPQRKRAHRERVRAKALRAAIALPPGVTLELDPGDAASHPRDAASHPRDAASEKVTPAEPSEPAGPSRAGSQKEKRESSLSATPLPDGWEPPAGGRAEQVCRDRAAEIDARNSLQKFADHVREKGTTSSDWDAAAARWLLNEKPQKRSGAKRVEVLGNETNPEAWEWKR